MSQPNSDYRAIPSVDRLLAEFDGRLARPLLVAVIRDAIDRARAGVAAGQAMDIRSLVEGLITRLDQLRSSRVINASGVLLHTNLGRASWSARALHRAAEAAASPVALEIDLDTGDRGSRGDYVAALLMALTGCEDALVVNNNAGAVLLSLAALAGGRGVPVSRGELIEIGGSYRLPEVMTASGAQLVEVGTTNRTRTDDYEVALQIHDCAAILKVHPSNYEIGGFTEEASLAALAELASAAGVGLIHDIGSGLLDREAPGLPQPLPSWLSGEPAARQSLEAGASLVTFSGDKLLGGPQAGIIVGTSGAVEAVRSHPLARALRIDGVTDAALAATLEAHAEGQLEEIPFWRQALEDPSGIEGRARGIADSLGAEAIDGMSTIGAGSAPGATIPTTLVRLAAEDHLYNDLLGWAKPILTRRQDGALVIDPRTMSPDDDQLVMEAVRACR